MTDDELAAAIVALQTLAPAESSAQSAEPTSRWKLAARRPDLELEELRAL